MFPDVRFLGLGLYEWFMVLGVFAALIVLRIYSEKLGFSARLTNLCIFFTVAAVISGYGSAVLFQSFYDFLNTGKFTPSGATFYGGLIGGTAIFLILYFTVARKLCKEEIFSAFPKLIGIAACCVCVAHGIGRIGCLLGGCCYGRITDSPIGIYFPELEAKIIPVQLFESAFLFVLFAGLSFLLLKKIAGGTVVASLYMVLYGIFRFMIEFLRDDDRGTFLPGLSPSQFWSFVLILFGAAILVVLFIKNTRSMRK